LQEIIIKNIVTMKTIFAILTLLTVNCFAAPALQEKQSLASNEDDRMKKGELYEVRHQLYLLYLTQLFFQRFWIPGRDFVSGLFYEKSNDIVETTPLPTTSRLENEVDEWLDSSEEWLEEINDALFGPEEES